VTSLDGRTLDRPYDVERALLGSRPAQAMEVAYVRKGEPHVVRVVLGRDVPAPPATPFSTRIAGMLSFEVRALTPDMGVVVTRVRPDRPAGEAGPLPGDIVREIDQQPIRSLREFERLADAVKPGDWLAMLVQRGRTPVYVAVHARMTELSAAPGSR
jgi:serine protease Do